MKSMGRKIDFKNLGWFISTALNRAAYVVVALDALRFYKGEITSFDETFLYRNTLVGGILLMGWLWSLYRNGIQLSVRPYLEEWSDQQWRKKKNRRCNIIFIDRYDDNEGRIAK